MKIAIIAAMEEEVSILKSSISNRKTHSFLDFDFYTGQIQNCDIILLQSGIGKVATATSTTLLLSQFNDINAVINTGSAGGLNSDLNIGDIVISNEVIYHDVDLTAFGYKTGQMANCPASFTADVKLKSLAQQSIVAQGINAIEGMIVSGDSFINGDDSLNKIKQNFPTAIAVEMEASAIAHVCWLFKKPFIIIRAISDNSDKDSAVNFYDFLTLASKQSSKIVEEMLSRLANSK